MALAVHILRRFDDLLGAREVWRALLSRSGDPQVTLGPEWMLTWWRVFGPRGGRELRACLVYDGRRPVGLAPLLARNVWRRPGVPLRRLELLGSGEDEADEVTSEYIGAIAEAGRERAVASALAGALARGELGPWDELVLERLSESAPMTRAIEGALRARGIPVERAAASVAFHARLPGSWDDYLAALPRSRRYRLRRALRDFSAWAGGDYRLECARDGAELERALAILKGLHAERWRADGRDGAFASPRFRRFHDAVLPALFRRGEAQIAWLTAHGKPVAAAYHLVSAGRVQFYQSGRRVSVPGAVKPGIALHALAIDAAIREGHREYDFLAGRARYKQELGPDRRGLTSLRATRPWSAREGIRRAGVRSLRTVRDAVASGRAGADAAPRRPPATES